MFIIKQFISAFIIKIIDVFKKILNKIYDQLLKLYEGNIIIYLVKIICKFINL